VAIQAGTASTAPMAAPIHMSRVGVSRSWRMAHHPGQHDAHRSRGWVGRM
jgi:hypothetical protein